LDEVVDMNFQEITWAAPPSQCQLANDEVHVWRIPLAQTDSKIQFLAKFLSPDEQIRSANFYFDRDRRRFTVSHAMLRIILGHYGSMRPEQIRYEYNPFGKPVLAAELNGMQACFNLSHSNDLALLAVTQNREVGIDLEFVRPIPEAEQIAAKTFAGRENAAIQTQPEELKTQAFFNCWTRKEAYIKAVGDGLSRPLNDFEVSVDSDPKLLHVRGLPEEVVRWSFHAFIPAAGYIAALVVNGENDKVSFWEDL
jgi:4'-phosphopantetheinyl transferase